MERSSHLRWFAAPKGSMSTRRLTEPICQNSEAIDVIGAGVSSGMAKSTSQPPFPNGADVPQSSRGRMLHVDGVGFYEKLVVC
jgi:hypothetical protein